jgi:hypothetical protein
MSTATLLPFHEDIDSPAVDERNNMHAPWWKCRLVVHLTTAKTFMRNCVSKLDSSP